MATATYTVRLGMGQVNGPADQLVYTAGSDEAIVIRDIVVANVASAAQIISVHLVPGDGNWIRLLLLPAAAVNESYHLELRQRMNAGDQLRVVAANGAATYAVTAYRFIPA